MAQKRRNFDAEFREGAVRIVSETGKPSAEVAKDPGINEMTMASRVSRAKRDAKSTPADKVAVITRLMAENTALKKDDRELRDGA
ncbi:transposase [Streptomyces sp. NPDC056224]|uniref:transposase n=1 Tax=Streptomyces sp. NPDC056224 TaxID=3345750 RepID=UPI0035DE2BB9